MADATTDYTPPAPQADQPPDATDRVYAQIVFDMAFAEGGRPRAEQVVDHVEHLLQMHSPEMREFLRSRIIPVKAKERVIRAVFGSRIDPILVRLMLLLNHKERLYRTRRVFNALVELFHDRFGRVEVDVYTAEALEPGQIKEITDALAGAIQRDIVLHTYTDDEMIGGIKLQVGDRLIDGSIATQLRMIRERLVDQGSANIAGRTDRMIND